VGIAGHAGRQVRCTVGAARHHRCWTPTTTTPATTRSATAAPTTTGRCTRLWFIRLQA